MCIVVLGVNVTNRVTPAHVPPVMSNVLTPRIRFAEHDDVHMLLKEEEDEQENFNELPRFGQPSVTASESQYKYGSTVKEIVNPYEIVPWSVQVQENFRNHCSVFIWLLLVLSVTTVTTRVSDDQQKLEIFTILPSILDKDRVDDRNARCFRDSTGQLLYPPSHIRSVSHKQALSTYAHNEKGQVVFKQTIYLPFRVGKEPCKMGGGG
jgi:hypothetical protein